MLRGRPWSTVAVLALAGASAAASGCGDDTPGAVRGDPVAGSRVAEAVEPACARCHSLAAAGWEGTIGPPLDQLRPGFAQTLAAIERGPGMMPSYGDELSTRQARDLAAYVSELAVRGGPG